MFTITELLRHFVLLEFIATEDDQSLDARVSGQHGADEGLAEGTGPARDEDGSMLQIELSGPHGIPV